MLVNKEDAMRLIRTFRWCKKYNLEQIEVDFDLNNKYIIVHNAKKIKRIRHMVDVIQMARQYPEYRDVLDKNIIRYVWKWLHFSCLKKDNNVSYLKFL